MLVADTLHNADALERHLALTLVVLKPRDLGPRALPRFTPVYKTVKH